MSHNWVQKIMYLWRLPSSGVTTNSALPAKAGHRTILRHSNFTKVVISTTIRSLQLCREKMGGGHKGPHRPWSAGAVVTPLIPPQTSGVDSA